MVRRWLRSLWEFIGFMAEDYAEKSFLTASHYLCNRCKSRVEKGADKCPCCKIGIVWPWQND